MKFKNIIFIILSLFILSGCVDQNGEGTLPVKKGEDLRVVATSPAVTMIMEKLDVDLIGVPTSNTYTIPDRYKDLPSVGMAMSPDMEIIKSLRADYVFSPASLIGDLLPKYRAANIEYGFLNLNNVPGMYKSIEDIGKLLGKEEKANELVSDYKGFMAEYVKSVEGKPKKKVLILMGLPGSFVVATEHSYVGSLVKLAGGENVYEGLDSQFLSINTEDMVKKDPDIILRTSHALPEEVAEMFKEEFSNNPIWKHFRAVESENVYDLDYAKFGMSAKFNYKEALEDLKEVLYD